MQAVAEIKKLGGIVSYAGGTQHWHPLGAELFGTVARVWFPEPVTDAALVHLKGLTHLQIWTSATRRVTDAGLESLKELTELQDLILTGTQVTDVGVENLKGLTQLQALFLDSTKVTDAGVKKLQRALPKCRIRR